MSDTKFWLDLEPVDALFFRDHSERRAGVDNWSSSVPPSPLTLFGAIASWLIEGFEVNFADFKAGKQQHELLGGFCPELCNLLWSIAGPFWGEKGSVYFPAPASAYFHKEREKYAWLIPSQETGSMFSSLPEELRPLVFADGRTDLGKDFSPAQGWIARPDLENFLQGENLENFSHKKEEAFSCEEVRCGIGINPETFSTKDGMFFITPKMRVKQGKVFSVQVRFASEDARARLENIISKNSGAFFGGERGRVKISLRKNEPVIAKPDPTALAEKGRFLLYLCTPSIFTEGWKPAHWPDCFSGAKLVGVALHKPTRISGWMQGQGPRRLFHATPGGSVYYFETEGWDKDRFIALIDQYHFNKSISDYYPCAGFGIACIGTWNKGGSHAA
jgi:CRISPR-associated protein Cmr3